jgi:hypothetical protein
MRINVGDDNLAEAVAVVEPIVTVFDDTVGLPKTFTTPDNETWRINWSHIVLTTSATVGNRQIRIYILDADGNGVMDFFPPVTQAASLERHYAFHQGIYRETAFAGDAIQIPIPPDLYMTPGFQARVVDANDVDGAADEAVVSFQYRKFVGNTQ